MCHFVLVFFSPFSIAITSLGEEGANFSAFRTVCASLDLSVSSWGLGRAAVCDCGTPWTFVLPFLDNFNKRLHSCRIFMLPKNDNVTLFSCTFEICRTHF